MRSIDFTAQKRSKFSDELAKKKLKVVRFAPNAFFYKIDQNPDS